MWLVSIIKILLGYLGVGFRLLIKRLTILHLAKRATTGIAPVSPGILQGILLFELRCWGSEPNRTAIFRVERRTLYH